MKICINSKHFVNNENVYQACDRKAYIELNVIDGTYETKGLSSCLLERSYFYKCGKRGKYFEPKGVK